MPVTMMMAVRRAGLRMGFRAGDSVDSVGSGRAVTRVPALALAPIVLLVVAVDRVNATLQETLM